MKAVIVALQIFLLSQPASAFCFDEAAGEHDLNSDLLLAIAWVESRFNHKAVGRGGRTTDYGIMQISSWWRPKVDADTWRKILEDPCENVKFGAGVLADCVRRLGETWKAVGCYNSRKTEYQVRYAWKVYHAYENVLKVKRKIEKK